MNPKNIAEMVMELSILPYFPAEDAARMAIVRMVGAMAANESQVRWLVNVMTSGAFAKWEGPAELRAVFCMKYKPKDGIEAVSSVYPDGMSREQLNPGKRLELEDAPMRQIESGPVSQDTEIVELVAETVQPTSLGARIGRIEPSVIGRDENEYDALLRRIKECRREPPRDPLEGAKPATEAEIELLKLEQERNRKYRPELVEK